VSYLISRKSSISLSHAHQSFEIFHRQRANIGKILHQLLPNQLIGQFSPESGNVHGFGGCKMTDCFAKPSRTGRVGATRDNFTFDARDWAVADGATVLNQHFLGESLRINSSIGRRILAPERRLSETISPDTH